MTLPSSEERADRMTTLVIKAGDRIKITDATGKKYEVEALSGVEQTGHGFAVVWVNRPLADGGFDPFPWPLEAVALDAAPDVPDDDLDELAAHRVAERARTEGE